MYFPDLGTETMIASGPKVRAVGWLSSAYPFDEGRVEEAVITKLQTLVADGWIHVASAGPHLCELCSRVRDASNVIVPSADFLYVAPAMVVHYIRDHGYEPPGAFLRAVLRCPPPPSDAYFAALEPFLDLLSPPGAPMTPKGLARSARLHREYLVKRAAMFEAEEGRPKGIFWD